ncbi:uncharacterized protein LOC105354276 isoform X2 [Oryzias latipes]
MVRWSFRIPCWKSVNSPGMKSGHKAHKETKLRGATALNHKARFGSTAQQVVWTHCSRTDDPFLRHRVGSGRCHIS